MLILIKYIVPYLFALRVGCLIVIVCASNFACGGPEIKSPDKSAATPKPTPTELEVSGAYTVTGENENGSLPYEGLLTIANHGDVYDFRWQTDRPRPLGVGVQFGDAVAVSYADPSTAKGCGVALYRIASDGSLDGRIARWGEYTYGTEKATRTEGTNFDAKYRVTGKNSDGSTYEGTIEVEKNGNGHRFAWHTGSDQVGFGIWRGDRAAIGFGGKQCSFVIYKIQSGRLLEGFWGSPRSIDFGTETAKRP